eukprot:scaffold39012_cov191-Amphora_coffeaeformis.AAC.2
MAIDPGDDFSGYMEDLEQRRQNEAKYREQVHQHEIWRQTTWGGWLTRQLQALGNHFAPFFRALADAMAAEGDSFSSMALVILIRVLLIGSCILAVYTISKVVNMIVGREIVIEEVIVVEEDEKEEEESKKMEVTKRVSRGKKQK